jgi:hypothetical protein
VAAGTAVFALWLWDRWIGQHGLPARLGATFIPMALASLAYFLTATALGIREASDVMTVLRWRSARRKSAPASEQTSG